ncbi:MAG: nickel pincer cofactor biosynthesis protein LarC [Actinobacteria bacterium]|nr:nickel pincer cofactor biosynthesis protein LarC [Actinomycetota bacterium]
MIGYIDCFCGAAGDMLLAAFLDAGADLDWVRKQIEKIDLAEPVSIETTEVNRGGLRGLQLQIDGAEQTAARSHSEIARLLDGADLDGGVEQRARRILDRLIRAEAAVHGTDSEGVHLHEIAAADTIVDVVGTSAAVESLALEEIVVSPVATGVGTIDTAHGVVPNPSPVVVELMKGAPIYARDMRTEILTPTGAALISELASSFGALPPMAITRSGYGAGTKELEIPNLIRVIVGEPIADRDESTESLVLEANIDDMNPEIYSYVSERLFAAGADDVWIIPGIGKAGRPLQVLSVLSPTHLGPQMREIMLTETSSLGVRARPVSKWMTDREWIEVKVEGLPVRVKIGRVNGKPINFAPEYLDCAQVATKTGTPLKEIFRLALTAATARQATDAGRPGSGLEGPTPNPS